MILLRSGVTVLVIMSASLVISGNRLTAGSFPLMGMVNQASRDHGGGKRRPSSVAFRTNFGSLAIFAAAARRGKAPHETAEL